MAEVRPFTVAWGQAKWRALGERFRAFRFPQAPPEIGWRYGCDPEFLRAFRDAWLALGGPAPIEAELNQFPQTTVTLDGLSIHAVHVVGESRGRRPLLLIHGWPGSVLEFYDVIAPLAFPSRHGGREEEAFDLVIPSLPGFGFSEKPAHPIGARTTARLFDRLMREALGYRRYAAQGGDWGAGVGAWLGLEHGEALAALHLNYLLVQPPAEPETAEEKDWRAAFLAAQQALGAYAQLQGTKPQSLAYAMADNPLAQAAWLIERFHDWADLRRRPFEEVFPMRRLLGLVALYLMNDAFIPAIWYYAAALTEGVRQMPPGRRVEVPTAFTAYPDPRAPAPPASWVRRGYALSRWVEAPVGGHFAALEVPKFFAADLRDWGRTIAW